MKSSIGRTLANFFDHTWSAGLATFLCGVILALFRRYGLPQEVSMSLLLSLAVAKLAAMMQESHKVTRGSVIAARDNILRSQEPDLSRMASILDDGYLRILSQMALNTNKELMRELTNAEKSISGERNLTLYLTQHMSRLKSGEEAFALCWRKSWGLAEVKRYFYENIQALKRGCRIHRIFVQDGTFSAEQLRIMDDQARAGATVLAQLPRFAR